jgi:hypothetical protein
VKKLITLLASVAVLTVPAMASAATYNATMTVTSTHSDWYRDGVQQVHTFSVAADCVTGHYTGTGSTTFQGANAEDTVGDITAGGFAGSSLYREPIAGGPYSWSYALTSSDTGATYSGTGSDAWNTWDLTGTLSTGNKVTACATRNAPAVTSKDQCKKDGWKSVSRLNDTAFKNQGDCVSYTETGV